MAYFSNMIYFTKEGKAFVDNKNIYVDFPQKLNKEERLTFLSSICHEFTHILQEESKDRVPKADFLNKFINNRELTPDIISTIKSMPQAFSMAEYNITLPLYKALQKEDELPRRVGFLSGGILDKIYLSQTGQKTDQFIETIIDFAMNRLEAVNGKFDKKTIKEYISLIAEKEREAHSNSTVILKKELNIQGPSDLDLRVSLYDRFAQKVQQLADKTN